MSERFRLSTGPLLAILLLVGLSIYLSFYPLWHTDVWAHAKYGEWYWTHRAAPDVEPLSPFSDKSVPFANVAWLSQVTYYLLFEMGAAIAGGDAESRLFGGAEALRSFHLVVLLARFAVLWLALRRFGGSANWATLGVFLYMMAVGLGSAIQRPQALGLFFFTLVVLAISTPTVSRRAMVWLPLSFLLWANLHGTFMAGLALLGVFTVGRAIERGLFDKEIRRLVLLGLLCGLATIVNPHGPLLVSKLLEFSSHPNLKTMTEWYPMRFSVEGGSHWPYLMSLVLLAFVRILGRRKVGASGWLVAVPFALWPWLQIRMILWWWTVAVWLLAKLGPGLADRFPTMPAIPDGPPSRANAWIAVAAILAAVVCFPPIRALLPEDQRKPGHVVSAEMPWELGLELTAAPQDEGRWLPELRKSLREHYPDGQFRGAVFASETQGDFLVWQLPADKPVLLFTHAHVFSVEYWDACRHVKAGNPGWREFLATHRTNLIVVEWESHLHLVQELQSDPEWIVWLPYSRTEVPIGVMIALRKRPL